MWFKNPFVPEQASEFASSVDTFYFFMVSVSAFFAILVVTLVAVFAIRYRRRHEHEAGTPVHGALALELTWTLIPLGIAMVMFFWGASIFFAMSKPPSNAMEIYVVGKRWMWKFQHMTGQREINELHVPVGQPVKLLVGSEDVIHSVYIPAFRVKMDAVPGRTTTLWFTPTKTGRYHLFCAEYCGQKHSGMRGTVVVLEPAEFQAWLAGGPATGSMADAGQKLFNDLACATCHRDDASGRGPSLKDVFGSTVTLAGGATVTADDAYLRESIVNPQAKIVEGYAPLMPTFQGLVTEEQLNQLIAYIKAQAGGTPGTAAPATGTPAPGAPAASGTQPSTE
ncbi:MAG: cytochrome c oxidase subunit II [Vicinamibacteraceae bacterium]|nr:cytochrome c oxidase subunit II [Vicinamibacteraceae bacterium]